MATTKARNSYDHAGPQYEVINVDWDGPDDPQNPVNWSNPRKLVLITLISLATFAASMASTNFAPGVPMLMEEFHSPNEELASFVVSVYILGFAIGPLFFAPMSELYGRSWPAHVSNILSTVFSAACAVSSNIAMFTVFRFLMGVSGSLPLTIGGGVIADVMQAERRGKAMTVWGIGPLLGPVIGPIVGGYIAQSVGWRWIFWLMTILDGALALAFVVAFKEPHGPTLLDRKATKLQKSTNSITYKPAMADTRSASAQFRIAILRPTKMLLLSPIVLILAVEIAVIYSYLYFLFTTFTPVFGSQYHFGAGDSGLSFLGLGVGLLIGIISVGAFSQRPSIREPTDPQPERFLLPAALGAFIVPAGLFWYGWTAEHKVHWIVPILGATFLGFGATLVFLTVQMYLVETYTIYAASAIATNTVVRNLLGGTLPLASGRLYGDLGLGWGNSLLGFIALILSPIPLLLVRYGKQIRRRSRFESDI